MFNVASGLGDRFKSVVKDLEATGASLQARASQAAGPLSPESAKGEGVTSPVKSPSFAATGFLSDGLKRGFALGRSSMEGHARTTSGDGHARNVSGSAHTAGGSSAKPPTELKDIPTSPLPEAVTSRPNSPARFLNSSFAIGSLNSTRSPTPNPSRSPKPPSSPSQIAVPTISLPPAHLENDYVPNPNDPATYPLPPSPTLGPELSPEIELALPKYADPLGASPILPPQDDTLSVVPPAIDVQNATPNSDDEPASDTKTSTVPADQARAEGSESDHSSAKPEPSEKETSKSMEVAALPSPRASMEGEEDVNKKLASSERRYEDLSKRFTTLLSQTHAANKVLRDYTQVEGGIADADAFEGWVRMMKTKVDMGADEMRRLQDKIRLQDSRIEEIRDTHRLESSSSTELVAKLRSQISQAEAKLSSEATQMLTVSQLRADLSKAQTTAKEEEEKRTKAVSLLKTLRLKNVKLEKEKEEIEKDRAEERAERSRATEDMERVKAEREREVIALRKGFEREVAGLKEKYERELAQKKGAWELEMITTKATHAKELANKSSRLNSLDASVKELTAARQKQFDVLELKQSDLEAAQSELESHQTITKELQYQLREAQDRCALLEDSLADSKRKDRGRPAVLGRSRENASPSPSPSRSGSASNLQTVSSSADVTRLLSEAEARSEAKMSDLRAKIRSLEKERNEAEEEWARNLQDRLREVEKLRRTVQEKDGEYAESVRTRKDREARIEELEVKVKEKEKQINGLRAEVAEAESDKQEADNAEKAARDEIAGLQVQISTLQGQLDEAKGHAAQLKANNKTVRDELRKVQSSVQLLERQRNPGVGYWSAAGSGGPSRSGIASPESIATPSKELRRSLEHVAETQSTRTSSPAPSERGKEEEEVNLEYLRNVILQFLENKEMRPNLVRVLSVILRFTPQELRRLNAKLLS